MIRGGRGKAETPDDLVPIRRRLNVYEFSFFWLLVLRALHFGKLAVDQSVYGG